MDKINYFLFLFIFFGIIASFNYQYYDNNQSYAQYVNNLTQSNYNNWNINISNYIDTANHNLKYNTVLKTIGLISSAMVIIFGSLTLFYWKKIKELNIKTSQPILTNGKQVQETS